MKALMRFTWLVMVPVLLAQAQAPQVLWTRTYGGLDDDIGNYVQQTRDSGYIILGTKNWFWESSGDIILIKTDANGDTSWTRTYGGSNYDFGECVRQTSDDGYIICGTSGSGGAGGWDIILIKIDEEGNTEWTHNYGGSSWEEGHCVQQTSDGGYIVVGNSCSFGGCDWDLYLVRTDNIGREIWSQVYELYGNYWEFGRGVLQTPDGGFIVVGEAAVFTDSYDVLLIKTDAQGDTLWTRTYGNADDYGRSINFTSDGGYIIAGESWFMEGHLYLIRTNSLGDTLWTRQYNGGYHSWGYSAQQTLDGGFIAVGWASSAGNNWDIYVVKTDANGDSTWTRRIGGHFREEGHWIQQTRDGNYILTGFTQPDSGADSDIWLVCLGGETLAVGDFTNQQPGEFELNAAYPNPFNSSTVISYEVPTTSLVNISIYNILGQSVATLVNKSVNPGSYSVVWNAEDIPSGVYFCKMEGNGFERVRKIVLLK
jgi:hypothetical protein